LRLGVTWIPVVVSCARHRPDQQGVCSPCARAVEMRGFPLDGMRRRPGQGRSAQPDEQRREDHAMATEETRARIDRKRLRSRRLREGNFQGDVLRLGMNWTEEDLRKPQVLVESAYGDRAPRHVSLPGPDRGGLERRVRGGRQAGRARGLRHLRRRRPGDRGNEPLADLAGRLGGDDRDPRPRPSAPRSCRPRSGTGDPPDNPLFGLDNVVVTPHAACYSEESIPTVGGFAAEEVVRVLTGQAPLFPVNAGELIDACRSQSSGPAA
jgi:hypothetical protein